MLNPRSGLQRGMLVGKERTQKFTCNFTRFLWTNLEIQLQAEFTIPNSPSLCGTFHSQLTRGYVFKGKCHGLQLLYIAIHVCKELKIQLPEIPSILALNWREPSRRTMLKTRKRLNCNGYKGKAQSFPQVTDLLTTNVYYNWGVNRGASEALKVARA